MESPGFIAGGVAARCYSGGQTFSGSSLVCTCIGESAICVKMFMGLRAPVQVSCSNAIALSIAD